MCVILNERSKKESAKNMHLHSFLSKWNIYLKNKVGMEIDKLWRLYL